MSFISDSMNQLIIACNFLLISAVDSPSNKFIHRLDPRTIKRLFSIVPSFLVLLVRYGAYEIRLRSPYLHTNLHSFLFLKRGLVNVSFN